MSTPLTLGYWNIRGYAQRIRLLLEYLQVPYSQVIYTPQTQNEWFGKTKLQHLKKNPAANLPYLIDGEKLICETDAIIVYICHKYNRLDLLGQTADQQVQLATVMGVFKDASRSYIGYVYGQKPYEQFKDEAYNSLKPHLQKLNDLLADKQWFCSKLTYCDLILGEFFQVASLFTEQFVKDFPKLKNHQQRLWQLEGISEYLKSDRFKERPINYYPDAKWF